MQPETWVTPVRLHLFLCVCFVDHVRARTTCAISVSWSSASPARGSRPPTGATVRTPGLRRLRYHELAMVGQETCTPADQTYRAFGQPAKEGLWAMGRGELVNVVSSRAQAKGQFV